VNRLCRLFRTSIGRKVVVAVTGLLLIGFLMVHASGNLLILKGPESLNAYADWLQGHPLLWVFRLLLLGLLIAHVLAIKSLARENRRARPVRYGRFRLLNGSLFGRTMLLSGIAILAFVVFHLLHLTLRVVGPQVDAPLDAAGRVDVYQLVIAGFNQPLITAVYLLAIALLGMHLAHAVQSLVQTLGFNHESYQPHVRLLTLVVSLSIVAGFASVPILVQSGVIAGTAG
jgi:succinate dehydrogenase / fumarate reductase cytochrome b subunit